jgi:hypothetical protein
MPIFYKTNPFCKLLPIFIKPLPLVIFCIKIKTKTFCKYYNNIPQKDWPVCDGEKSYR